MYGAYDVALPFGGLMDDDEDGYVNDETPTAAQRVMAGEHKRILAEDGITGMDQTGDGDDVDAEDEEEELVDNAWLDSMPAADMRLVQVNSADNGSSVRYTWAALPSGMPGFPPIVLNGISKSHAEMASIQGELAQQLCLPIFIHISPAVLLFASHFIAPGGPEAAKKVDTSTMERRWWPRCVSLLESWSRLIQFRDAALKGHAIELSPHVRPQTLWLSYTAALQQLANTHDMHLDNLYQGVSVGEISYPDALNRFVALGTQYAFSLVHIPERLLYELLVQPYVRAPDLCMMLTPSELPPPSALASEDVVRQLRRDAKIFFARKQEMLEQAGQKWYMRTELLDTAPIDPHNDIQGWMPPDLVRDYFHFADDKRLCVRYAPEHWNAKDTC